MRPAEPKQERVNALRAEALGLARAGKHQAALEKFSLLATLQESEAEWPRRAAECHQALGNQPARLEALCRAAERYVKAGMLVKAMAVCKIVLGVDPGHPAALSWMSKLESSAAKPGLPPARALPTRQAAAPAPAQPAPAVSDPFAARAPRVPAAPHVPTELNPARELVATRGLVAVTREIARRSGQNKKAVPEAEPEPKLIEAAPPSSGAWQAVDDAELLEADLPPPAVLSLPPLSLESVSLRDLIPGSMPVPGGGGKPSGMFRLAIDEGHPAPTPDALRQAREVLPAIPLFSELDPQTLEGLLRQCRLIQPRAGQRVFSQGDPPDSLYVIVNGRVAVIDEAASRVTLYHLGENEFFGESALISNEPQAVTVEACEDLDLLAFDRGAMQSCIRDNPFVVPLLLRFLRARMIDQLVHTSSLLTGFDTTERRALSRRFEFIEFATGSELIHQGARSPGLFVLLSGAVEVLRREAQRIEPLAKLERGGIFGEMSLLGRPAAVADVRGLRAGFALMLPAAEFRDVIMTHPQFLEVVTMICEQRREMNARLFGFQA